mmetsp:Transcript_41349/g.107072  ORF Transcript_41349/g.107072 Transcript_41349/m.107072 type:complete len:218 (-) Transcript_41349:110-763(-)
MVGIVLLGVDAAVADDVLEGVVHEAALAAVVAGVAVHQLLLAQRHHLAGEDLVDALDGAGGGERPARAALRLVLHLADGARLAPVHRGLRLHIGVHKGRLGAAGARRQRLLRDREAEVEPAVLLHGQVGERVQVQPVAGMHGVVLQDVRQVVLEDLKAAGELGSILNVLLGMVGHPGGEGLQWGQAGALEADEAVVAAVVRALFGRPQGGAGHEERR